MKQRNKMLRRETCFDPNVEALHACPGRCRCYSNHLCNLNCNCSSCGVHTTTTVFGAVGE